MQLLPTIVGLASLFSTANAHVTANPSVGKAGGYIVSVFRVPHGCGKSPTVNVTIQIPKDIKSPTPQMVAGWKLSYGYRPLDTPITTEGVTVNTTVASITYSGNSLPADNYADFGISMKLPAKAENNNTLYFPVYQVCENGTNYWTKTADSNNNFTGEIAAPTIKLTEGDAKEGSSSGSGSSGTKGNSGYSVVPTSAVLITSLVALFAAI
ncbi:DUF1775-domain-containing protein [Conidiobolus coronatus NRRL 28638]|uniref:DUF1775-domain-containing protein n=1 Tax=Conidiobolus coronatus (strain ATCC 28846 / CBS 209.66 / NRRL 28638) TaxID=796925 RepID=A0A137P7C8_CONC2|nr:DUF1775-domain-containing protein [Conidiobolus coronatus NRRL 28638]|eukprot:KXN70831.1 DUF1775-domain-containing protein [Conidiobolus coronatus NRRL 28638]